MKRAAAALVGMVSLFALSACDHLVLIVETDQGFAYSRGTLNDMAVRGGIAAEAFGMPAEWDRAAFWRSLRVPGRTDVKLNPDTGSTPGEGYRLVLWINPEGGRRRVTSDRLCRSKASDLPSGPLPEDVVIQGALCAWDRFLTAATLITTRMKPGEAPFQFAADQLMLGLFPPQARADVGSGDTFPR